MPLWTQMGKNRQYSILGAQGGISGNTKEDPGHKEKEIASLNKGKRNCVTEQIRDVLVEKLSH